jgi:hypothetical protein
MIKNQCRRITRALGAAAGALTIIAFLPMAVAFADDNGWVPDPTTLFPVTEISGFPPYSPEVLTAHEAWSLFDFTTNTVLVPDQLDGLDTETIFGAFTNNDFSNGDITSDLANFGNGWENLWVDFTGSTGAQSDLLITPFGDFPLFGTFFP